MCLKELLLSDSYYSVALVGKKEKRKKKNKEADGYLIIVKKTKRL